MTHAFDSVLGLNIRALQLRGERSQLLASNIANADTPNFLARDLDFKAVLAMQQGQRTVAMQVTRVGHMGASSSQSNRVMYRQPSQPSADGNTVEIQLEKSSFTENAVAYQAQLTFLKSQFGRLLTAFRGE